MKDLFFFLALTLLVMSCKDKDNTQPITTNNPLATKLDSLVHQEVSDYAKKKAVAGFSIGVIQNGETHFYGYGETTEGNAKIPDENTMFEIGSITKTFTATVALMEFGKIRPIYDFPIRLLLPTEIPTLSKNGKEIMLQHLLNHTSGLPRLPDDIDDDWDSQNPYAHYDSTMMYNYLKNYQLKREPGALFEYSNLGMGLAGVILERQLHKSYEQIIIEKVATPLGMNRTKITRFSQDQQNTAKPHDAKGKVVPYWDFNAYKGAGALLSTSKDMLIYAKKHLDTPTDELGQIFQQLHQITYEGKGNDGNDYKIGLGWLELTINNQKVYVHDGGTGGFSTFIFVCPSKNLAMVFLANNTDGAGAPETAVRLFEALSA